MIEQRLLQQMEFIVEIDKLKNIVRKTKLVSADRFENDAEHSWHLAVMAIMLAEHANDQSIDLLKVIKMLLIHDIVEIDAGDTFVYDDEGNKTKQEREEKAAKRIFGMLPQDQCVEFQALWDEFELRETNEAKYAASLDRLQPLLFNYYNKGETWQTFGITSDKVYAHNVHIAEGSNKLWDLAKTRIDESVEKGYLRKNELEL